MELFFCRQMDKISHRSTARCQPCNVGQIEDRCPRLSTDSNGIIPAKDYMSEEEAFDDWNVGQSPIDHCDDSSASETDAVLASCSPLPPRKRSRSTEKEYDVVCASDIVFSHETARDHKRCHCLKVGTDQKDFTRPIETIDKCRKYFWDTIGTEGKDIFFQQMLLCEFPFTPLLTADPNRNAAFRSDEAVKDGDQGGDKHQRNHYSWQIGRFVSPSSSARTMSVCKAAFMLVYYMVSKADIENYQRAISTVMTHILYSNGRQLYSN